MTMNRFILIAGVILGMIVIVILSILIFSGKKSTPPPTQSPGFPISSTTGSTSGGGGTVSGGTQNTTITITTRTGNTVTTKDFVNNGVTTPDVANPGSYYLAGSIGYCLKDGSCPSGASESDFKVVYDSKSQYFTIALIKEPIGQARLHAEAFLEQTLGVPISQLCDIKYYLGTDVSVNTYYAGSNLGFSTCFGAKPLPN
jgi:hypothetical protein